jgi:hypothetical protein
MVLVPYLPPVRFSPPAVCWVSKQAGGAADLRRCGCGCGWERERRRWEGRNRGGDLRWGRKGTVGVVLGLGNWGYSALGITSSLTPEGPGPGPCPPPPPVRSASASASGGEGGERRARSQRSTCGGGMVGNVVARRRRGSRDVGSIGLGLLLACAVDARRGGTCGVASVPDDAISVPTPTAYPTLVFI